MERHHSLDKLRASMMLLGIWLHTVVGYSREGGWPYKDPSPTAAFDWTLALIHTFRMPLFMALAGFFGALLWERRGAREFVSNRVRRIALPFVLGWLAVIPVSLLLAAYSRTGSISAALGFFTSGAFVPHLHPGHLWFLEYLVVIYATVYVAVVAAGRLPDRLVAAANAAYRRALASRGRAVLFAIPSAGTLVLMRGAFLEDPPGFVPVPRIVLAYLVPFGFGWLLHANRDLLPVLERRAWVDLAVAAGVFATWMLFAGPRAHGWGAAGHYARAGAGALVLWLLSFGLIGVFLRHAAAERPLWRYLSDGSYWMYVVHMPVVMAFQMALAGVPIPTEAKVLMVVAGSFLALVASYDLVARPTWIGVLLNGRRYPRRYFVRRSGPLDLPSLAVARSQ
jgi:peptidoglycan/LPS O-acetylase OafA/YrhL